MKELSVEQKARAYDEAISMAKRFYTPDSNNVNLKATLEMIFPELVESEDEEIRKAIKSVVSYNVGSNKIYGVSKEDMLDWIEKQGEPVEINPTEFDTRLQSLIGKFGSLPKEELIGSLSFWINVVQNDGTYKPAEKQGEQKPAWSEEDERIRIETIELLETANHPNKMCSNGKPLDFTENINWLKSLRPQSQWKPTKRQLLELSCAISGYSFDAHVLVELEQDLKKLIKE